MPLRLSVRQLISARAVCALLLVAAITANVNPVHAQWDRDGYFTGENGERDEPRDKRRPRPPRTPSDSYDFGGDQRGDKVSGIADVSYFYEALDDGGAWMNHPRYGDVWQPYVDEAWRPYTLGRWAYSDDYGWTWVSDEPFGWAVYHYGRWSQDDEYGWIWVPGTQWAPAWVAWRHSDEAIGWAPLPPEPRARDGQDFDDGNLVQGERFNRAWVFVRPRYFARPEMRRYVRPPSWNADLVVRSTPQSGFERRDRHIRNRGLPPEDVERLSKRPVPRIRIAPVDDPNVRRPGRFDNWRSRAKDEVKIFRPERRRTEEAVRKFRKSQPGSGADVARESSGDATAPTPRAPRRIARPVPPGMYPGGKPAVSAARPPRFERGPADATQSDSKPEVNKPVTAPTPAPAPVAKPPATPPASISKPVEPVIINPSAAPAASPSADGPITGPNGKPPRDWRNPDQGAAVDAAGDKRDDRGASGVTPPPGAGTTSSPPRAGGKRRWDGSGPSGAPSTAEPSGE